MGTDGRARPAVVVVGGGFGGLQAALRLAATEVDLTLVDRRNFHLFQPLAYQVATGALPAPEVAHPLRSIFKRHPNVRVLLAEVTGFDLAARRVLLAPVIAGESPPPALAFDALIVAGGSQYSYFGHDEWAGAAPELKSMESLIDARRRILRAFEAAEVEQDPERRQAWRWRGRSARSPATRCGATSGRSTRPARASSSPRRSTGSSGASRRRSRR